MDDIWLSRLMIIIAKPRLLVFQLMLGFTPTTGISPKLNQSNQLQNNKKNNVSKLMIFGYPEMNLLSKLKASTLKTLFCLTSLCIQISRPPLELSLDLDSYCCPCRPRLLLVRSIQFNLIVNLGYYWFAQFNLI